MQQRFRVLVERMLAAGPLENEDGERVAVEALPPVSPERRSRIEAACGGAIPSELDAFLGVTAGLRHVTEFEPEPIRSGPDGLDNLLLAYDYGNGDGIGLEPVGERCRVWWFGHDPWFLVLWGASIESFLEQWVEQTERCRDEPDALAEPWRPTRRSEPRVASEIDGGADQELTSFLRALPSRTVVHDLRGALPGTEIPWERLQGLAQGGEMRRHDLVFAFLPPPRPRLVAPVPVDSYLERELSDSERSLLAALPKGALVIHERDLARGGRIDLEGIGSDQDVAFRPPFHIVHPKKKPWWRLW